MIKTVSTWIAVCLKLLLVFALLGIDPRASHMLAMFPLFSGIPSWNLKERGDLTDVGEIPWQFAEALMVQPFSSPSLLWYSVIHQHKHPSLRS